MTRARSSGNWKRASLAGGTAALLAMIQVAAADAQGETATTTPTAEEIAQKKALDEQTLRKATLENEKTEQELGIAKAKAISDAFPTSPTTGKTTLANDAGKIEASAMTATALNALAKQIAIDARTAATSTAFGDAATPGDVADCGILNPAKTQEEIAWQAKVAQEAKTGPAPILLFGGEEKLTFAHWDKFRFTACRLYDDFVRANKAAAKKLEIKTQAPPPAPGFEADPGDLKSSGVETIGAIATVASKLLQFVTPDWDVSGINVTATDKALAASVAREIVGARQSPRVRVYWGGQVSKLGGSKPVFNALDEIDKVDRLAAELLAAIGKKIEPHQKTLDDLAKLKPPLSKANEAKKAAATAAIAEWKKFSMPLTEAKAAYATLIKSLNGPDAEAALPINRVINEAAAARLLGGRGIALNVDVDNSGGSVQTRRSIFNLAGGGPPTWVSGGATVNFWAVRPADQQVLAAGQFTCLAGNVRLNKVAYHTNGNANGCPKVKPK